MSLTLAARESTAEGLRCRPDAVAAVEAVLALPDAQLDYAQAKLAFDGIIDPSVDEGAVLIELDRMAGEARRMAGPDATEEGKLKALRTLIYESGDWNGHRPFSYDHSDPLGRHMPNKLLHNYLSNRLGQCVSMPILFLILAERLGLRIGLARAPQHVFLRFKGAEGRTINLEATSGAHPARTAWYRRHYPISDRAIESGLYMRTLSRRDGIALMAVVVLEQLMQERRHPEAIEVAAAILKRDPRAGEVMVVQGSAYGHLVKAEFLDRYRSPFLIPGPLRPRYTMLAGLNNSIIEAAEAMGWEPME